MWVWWIASFAKHLVRKVFINECVLKNLEHAIFLHLSIAINVRLLKPNGLYSLDVVLSCDISWMYFVKIIQKSIEYVWWKWSKNVLTNYVLHVIYFSCVNFWCAFFTLNELLLNAGITIIPQKVWIFYIYWKLLNAFLLKACILKTFDCDLVGKSTKMGLGCK